jgi:sugar lactone lactonase YvrE
MNLPRKENTRPAGIRAGGKMRNPTLASARRSLLALCLATSAAAAPPAHGRHPGGQPSELFPSASFVTNVQVPLLQYPEGLTSWNNILYVGTYNIVNPTQTRIFAFNLYTGQLLNTIGGQPGQQLVSQGADVGLSVNQQTGDLFVNANQAGNVLRIHDPLSPNPQISIYASYPANTPYPPGPEDMAWDNQTGWLYDSDSNNGFIYAIPPGGGTPVLMFGPAGSGAKYADNGLFYQHVPGGGLSPNGLVFSRDYQTLYAANTDSDAILAMPFGPNGMPTGQITTLIQNRNDDLMADPTTFEALRWPDTRIGISAGTPLNGPDGLPLDAAGNIWVANAFSDSLTIVDPVTGRIEGSIGSSAATSKGLLDQPASLTFSGGRVYATNLNLFGTAWGVVSFDANVYGAGGNGNY